MAGRGSRRKPKVGQIRLLFYGLAGNLASAVPLRVESISDGGNKAVEEPVRPIEQDAQCGPSVMLNRLSPSFIDAPHRKIHDTPV